LGVSSLIVFATTLRKRTSVKIPLFLPSVSMHHIRAILFDLDNTLVDFIRMKEESCRAAVKAMVASGLHMDEDQAFKLLLIKYFDVGIESDRAFSEFLKSIGQFDHKILASGINTYLETKGKFLKPYPNVRSVLGKLKRKGVFLSIVTDAPKTKAYQRLLGMGIEPYFKFVVGYEDTNKTKHTGLPILLALEMLRKDCPEIANPEILMVGDSIERDIVPAKKLGLKTAIAKYGQKNPEEGSADYQLSDFKEIIDIVESFQ
jgi:phosphoglycolate phosphatase-like HAD superfamily hydrolase